MTLIITWKSGRHTILRDLPKLDADQIEEIYAHKKGVIKIERAA